MAGNRGNGSAKPLFRASVTPRGVLVTLQHTGAGYQVVAQKGKQSVRVQPVKSVSQMEALFAWRRQVRKWGGKC